MTSNDTWVQFSISRKVSDDNEKLGIDRWQPAGIREYADLITAELQGHMDTSKVLFMELEPYNNDAFYTLTARLTFDPATPVQAKTLLEGIRAQLAAALSEKNSYFDVEELVIENFSFRKDAILKSTRDPFTTDLLNLAKTLKDVVPRTAPWFEYHVNEKDLQGDTLIPVIDAQIARMEEKLTFAREKPFNGMGGNKTHEQQTRVIFTNSAPADGKMSELLREHVVNGSTRPEDIISELKTARDSLIALTIGVDFLGKPPRLNPGQEVRRLAQEFGPTMDRGGAQVRPEYLERTLADFPLDSIHGKMMRYGMFLATHLAMEIREGSGGTANIADLHNRLANELGATVTPPTPSVDDDYTTAPGL